MNSKIIFSLIFLVVASCHLYGQQVGHTQVTFIDASRNNRSIPVEVYYPATVAGNNTLIAPGVFPLISFGHGFVMTWSAYQNFWDDLVPEGYIVAFPTTETGFAPVHADFGLDLKFILTELQTTGVGTIVPQASIGSTSAILGHSMGGGSAFLAAENNSLISTMVSFAAANTNPSSITAAQQVSVPTLVFSGTNDCVAPPDQQQDIIYDSTAAAFKTQIYVSGGGHCNFANNNFNCTLGELTCSPSPTITRSEQQAATSDFLKLWLAYYLNGDCNKAQEFQDSLSTSSRITFRQSQSIACPTGIQEESDVLSSGFTLFPNPGYDLFTIEFMLSQPSNVSIEIFNALGRKVNVLLDKKLEPSNHKVTFTAKEIGITNGIYLVRITQNGKVFSKLLFVSN